MLFSYDANGSVVSVNFNGTDYYYVRNGQGDVVKLIDGSGNTVTEYTYDTWGKLLSCTGSLSSTLGEQNPFRYRGYVYDNETGFYYLQSRYYDPEVCRFISADVLLSTGQGVLGHNMFAYCLNNPVNRGDPSGCVSKKDRLLTESDKLYGGKTTSSVRNDLRKARNLNIFIADPRTYNCYGNAIGKQIVAKPTGYTEGDSTRKTFEAVCADLGYENVRELESINDPIGEDEYKVAIKCGPEDFHFIRLIGNNWFNKSGTSVGLFVDQSDVESKVWYARYMDDGRPRIEPTIYYDDEVIYFAVKKGWDD